MLDLSLQQLLFQALGYLVIAGVHGFLIAAVARLLGAMGPTWDGRLTPSPFAQMDLLGLLSATLGQVGWIRPVALDAHELRHGRPALAGVALLALALTLAVALGLWALRPVIYAVLTSDTLTVSAIVGLRIGVEMTVLFTLLNLLPLPGLTGGMFLQATLPKLHAALVRHLLVFRIAYTVLIVSGMARQAAQPLTNPLIAALLGR